MPVQDYRTIYPGPLSRYLRGGAAVTPPAADVTPPAVSNFDPPDGSRLATRESSIAFDVTDAGGFALVIVSVLYPGGVEVVAHDGSTFRGPFAGASARASITNGWRYTLRHAGGWPAAPTIRIHPVDTSGNAA
jgi:hypothetical protein